MAQQNVALNEVVESIVAGFDFRCQLSEVSLSVNQPDERFIINTDESALKHLIGNLVDNAIKFSPRQTAVTITLRRDAEHVSIDVHNCGPGIHRNGQRKAVYADSGKVNSGSSRLEEQGSDYIFHSKLRMLWAGPSVLPAMRLQGRLSLLRYLTSLVLIR